MRRSVLVILPLSSMKNIGLLGYTSGFSITIIFFFTIVTIVAKYDISLRCDLLAAVLWW